MQIHAHTLAAAIEVSDFILQDSSLTNRSANVVLNSTANRGCIGIDTVNDRTLERPELLRIGLESFDVALNPNRTTVVISDNTGNQV